MERLSVKAVKGLKPSEIRWDSVVRGFGARRQKNARVFILKTRARGRQLWFAIGQFGTYTVEQARKEAARMIRELRAGADPEMLRAGAGNEPTVNGLADRFIAEHIDTRLKPLTQTTFKRLLKAHIRPAIGKRLVSEVTTADMAALHHKMRATPRQANQTLAVASKMFSLAERWHLRQLNTNPCARLERYKEKTRNRFYTDTELAAIGQAVAGLEAAGDILPGVAAAIRLGPMTGLRLGELLNLLWSDVDLAGGAIELRDAKAGARRHAIGAAAIAYLSNLTRVGPWVCQGVAPDRRLSTRLMQYGWEAVRERAGLANARFHDFRHSYGTFAGATGASAFTVRDALGHKTLAMTGRYVNKDADPLKQLVDRVSDRVAAALDGKAAEIVPMKGAKRRK